LPPVRESARPIGPQYLERDTTPAIAESTAELPSFAHTGVT
jgi:hypothetical protein